MSPRWVLFDLDNTLWDFDGNAEEALAELFHRHHLHLRSDFSVGDFIDFYKEINAGYWKQYERGEVAKDVLRTARFTDTFIKMGIPQSEHPENLWEEYLGICPQMTRMVPGAMGLLDFCARNASLGLITNGFQRTQNIKIEKSGIADRIQFMLTSEDFGYAKPDKRIFHKALQMADAQSLDVIYIGDTLHTDVEGAIKAGLPVIWFNRTDMSESETLSHDKLYLGQFESHLQIEAFLSDNYGWV